MELYRVLLVFTTVIMLSRYVTTKTIKRTHKNGNKCHLNQRYQMEPVAMDWYEAGRFCELKGGRLATRIDEQQNAAILAILNSNGPYYQGEMVWIDGWSYNGDRNNCFWTKPWKNFNESFTYWHQGEPDNYNSNEHCLTYWFDSNSWMWNDGVCNDKYRFICEYNKATISL